MELSIYTELESWKQWQLIPTGSEKVPNSKFYQINTGRIPLMAIYVMFRQDSSFTEKGKRPCGNRSTIFWDTSRTQFKRHCLQKWEMRKAVFRTLLANNMSKKFVLSFFRGNRWGYGWGGCS